MDSILFADLTRYYIVVACLWTVAVFLRLIYLRWQRYGWSAFWGEQDPPHPLSTAGLAFLLFVGILRRFENLGKPGDLLLWLVAIGITTVIAGLMVNIRFGLARSRGRQ